MIMNISQKFAALTTASTALLHAGRKASAIALLSGHPPATYTAEALGVLNQAKRSPGVSVVMATYKGAERIGRALDSLAAQTLERARFEVVVVHNGPEDGTATVVTAFGQKHPGLNIVFLCSEPAGAGTARNVGCAAARFDHMTFLDDDDYLSPGFLKDLYDLADGSSIIFSQIVDFDDSGLKQSVVNDKLLAAFGTATRLKSADAPGAATALTMTCIKLFPSYIPEIVSYDPDLRNGEDVVFWTEALARLDPDIVLCPPEKQAIYYRENRPASISRQPTSFQFNVLDRIEVAKRINAIYEKHPSDFVKQKALAAAYFMVLFLKENPNEYRAVRQALSESGVDLGMLQYINNSLSKTLAISFCFPPWADTAGVVAAKRMLLNGRPFDIISNEMKQIRDSDQSLKSIAHDMIGSHVELQIPTKYTVDTESISNFSRRALAYTLNLNKYRKYEALYSRVMWPASHFAAGAIKAAIPAMRWTAEFSDPMVTDILSQPRPGKMDMAWLAETGIYAAIQARGFPELASESLMEWCEYIAYALADEVLFTNTNQRDYMLSQPWIAHLRHRIELKSVIAPHPTLPPDYYDLVQDDWQPGKDRVNIAYFGSFYKTRGLGEVLEALAGLDSSIRGRLRFDIYTAANPDLESEIRALGIADTVTIQPSLPFFHFLARCKAYDFLLANDAATRGLKPLNPYLPSKVSDYLGAGTAIWALIEEGSPLSKATLPARSLVSALGDRDGYRHTLEKMVENFNA